MTALERGFVNLSKHVENIAKFGVPAVIAINNFPTDTERELGRLYEMCHSLGVPAAQTRVWAEGGEGAWNWLKGSRYYCRGQG